MASWDPGEVTEDGFDEGAVVRREHDDIGMGSQTPPAHDHKGRPLAATALYRPVNRSLHRAQVEVEAELPKVAAAVERELRAHGNVRVATMKLSLDPSQRRWTAEGMCRRAGKNRSYLTTGAYYGELGGQFAWVRSKTASRAKTAGEIRFIKDKSGDRETWGWSGTDGGARELTPDYEYNPKKLKLLASVLRSTLASLGHTMSAYTTFTKIKSQEVSPDGQLGGLGYVTKITTMRQQFMNAIEAMSAMSDTLYDEVNAPHWTPEVKTDQSRERQTVKDILADVDEIRQDPEDWAEEEEAEMDAEHGGKTARRERPRTRRRPRPRKPKAPTRRTRYA